MKAGVQLALLCLSLLIWSLDGDRSINLEIDPESRMQIPVNFDAEDYSPFQVAENEWERNVMSHDSDTSPVHFRTRRQNNGKKFKPRKQRPGSVSTLAMHLPSSIVRAKRQTEKLGQGQRKRPWRPGKFSVLESATSQTSTSEGKIETE